jgi:hypothetical protein
MAACGTVPSPVPLEQELAGKNATERQGVLVDECKSQARQRVFRKSMVHDIRDYSDRDRLNDLCDAMNERMISGVAGNKTSLLQSCYKEANLSGISEARQRRMSAVCDAMGKDTSRKR